MIFKCKMCGGELNVDAENNVCTCQYCKTKQTIPNISNEIEQQLFDRANYYRFTNEFDKALAIYEQILEKNPKEPEAFWGVLLCRYGVEYVEDSKTKKRIPTCHRTCYESILKDLNYQSALKYATPDAAKIYKEEANYINDIQKKIKEISSKEEPFDIFISYKESNGNERTIDSVLAEEIYDNLTKKGYKVFFSRISLEGKLGIEYEPYIYAALMSSKVMLVVGTNKENMTSTWVRNEWNRYLALIKEGKEKILIPCYKDMNPYDMPDEFVTLQSQDMSKVGAIQDLLRGIDKIIKPSDDQINTDRVDYYILKKSLEKAFEFIQHEKWEEAKKRLDNAQDYDSHSAKIYLGYLLIDLKLHSMEELKNYPKDYFNNKNYKAIIKYADNELIEILEEYKKSTEKIIAEKNKEKIKKNKKVKKITLIFSTILIIILLILMIIIKIVIPNMKYLEALKLMEQENFENSQAIFSEVIDIKDAKEKKKDCLIQIQLKLIEENAQVELDDRLKQCFDELGKERIYIIAKAYYEKRNIEKFEEFYNKNISGYKDSDELLEKINKERYTKALNEYEQTNYRTARDIFEQLSDHDYKDSKDKYKTCIDIINHERKQYNGVWRESQKVWYNLKIDDTGIYVASQEDTQKNSWMNVTSIVYDEDLAIYTFEFFGGHKYNVQLDGNQLTLTCINLKEQDDSEWFGVHNKFYRQK